MQHGIKVALGTAVAGLAAVLAFGSPAAAGTPGDVEIQAPAFWVYEHDNYSGGRKSFTANYPNLLRASWDGQPGRIVNNNVSSMKNQTGRHVVMYDGAGYRGLPYTARPRSSDSDLSNNNFDNKASSIRFL